MSLPQLVDRITSCQDRYEFSEAGQALYSYIWGEFADWFVEASKARMYGGDAAAAATSRAVLVYVFDRLLRLVHPFMPYISEELWQVCFCMVTIISKMRLLLITRRCVCFLLHSEYVALCKVVQPSAKGLIMSIHSL